MRFSAKYIFRVDFFKKSALKMLFFHLHSSVKPGRRHPGYKHGFENQPGWGPSPGSHTVHMSCFLALRHTLEREGE